MKTLQFPFLLKSYSKLIEVRARRNEIRSEDTFKSLGFFVNKYSFYDLIVHSEIQTETGPFVLGIRQDFSIVEHARTIYTVWDLLGDIGGLFDMLKLLVTPMITFLSLIADSGLESHLINMLFKA